MARAGGAALAAACACAALAASLGAGADADRPAPSEFRVAFGSCNKANLPQTLWDDVVARQPALWIWAGDNVYLDFKAHPWLPLVHSVATNESIRANYAAQLANPDYRKLLDAVPVVGTWDDHDYGHNNAGWDLPIKNETRTAALDFLEAGRTLAAAAKSGERQRAGAGEGGGRMHPGVALPVDPERRTRPTGIYTSLLLNETGVGGRPVGVVLLDERWNKGRPGEPAPLLGAEQWRWLGETLRRHADAGAGLTIVVSSLTVLPEPRAPFESWDQFWPERHRLVRLLAAAGHPVVLASGDVHLGELGVARCTTHAGEAEADAGAAGGGDAADGGFTVLELTSSGMTHTHGDGWISWAIMSLLHGLGPFPHEVAYTLRHNFGELAVDWEAQTLTASLYGDGGAVLVRHTVPLADLVGDATPGDGTQPVVCRGAAPLWRVKLFLAAVGASVLAAVAAVAAAAAGVVRRLLAGRGADRRPKSD